jgi:hypothetical protein
MGRNCEEVDLMIELLSIPCIQTSSVGGQPSGTVSPGAGITVWPLKHQINFDSRLQFDNINRTTIFRNV